MYLFISEDGDIKRRTTVTDADIAAAEAGVLDIINISVPNNPVRYDHDGHWELIESWDD